MEKIPRKIHYCWFGGAEKSDLIKKCIVSWRRHLPDYEIIEWNESNFDINSNPFSAQAYQQKKWAFVSDYARLHILLNHGGIYLDTDMELLKSFDAFLAHRAFTGFGNENLLGNGAIGVERAHPWIEYLLTYYDDKQFIRSDGTFDTTNNVQITTNMTVENYNLVLDGKYQELGDGLVVFPRDHFYPRDWASGKISATSDTYAIHHCEHSWWDERPRDELKLQQRMGKMFGRRVGVALANIVVITKYDGFAALWRKVWGKLRGSSSAE